MGSAWRLNSEKLKFLQYPEALFIDTTVKSNNENYPLFLVVEKLERQIIYCNACVVTK